ncbi:MAG: hypothetical protein AAF528_09335 [Cyanobacteria bacterium P01_C01_bin.121]
MRGIGNVEAFEVGVVYSDDETIGNSDDVIVDVLTLSDIDFVINQLGQTAPPANALADFDGSGLITATDSLSAINRLGYGINKSVFEV